MSLWYHAREEDIELDGNKPEVNIFVPHENDQGSIYTILTFDQIKELNEKINEIQHHL